MLVLLASGCSKGHRDVALPSASTPNTPGITTSSASAEETVRQVYTKYWQVLPQAEQADSRERRHQLLADYAVPSLVDEVSSNIDRLHAKDLT